MAVSPTRLPVLKAGMWSDVPRLEHGFLTRAGGVSTGPFAELNLSFKGGDAPSAVEENWSRVRSHVGERLDFVGMNQVHGSRVVVITSSTDDAGEADGVISDRDGVGLCVLTADCVPILMLAREARMVAAVHAGWRGTLAGTAVEALERMVTHAGIERGKISVALGPAIGACCYEVDETIVNEIEARWQPLPEAIRRYRRDDLAKARLDLRAVNARLLMRAGVEPQAITMVGGCTACAGSFFSHRVATTTADGRTGRQLSFIGWAR